MLGASGRTRQSRKFKRASARNPRDNGPAPPRIKTSHTCDKEFSMKTPFLIGRLIFGGFFIYSGIHHFTEHKMMTGYAGSKNIPMPDTAVAATGAALVLGGASILAGVKPRLGTAAVIGFLAGVPPVMHDFWRREDPQERAIEMMNFGKNMAMLGGAMALM